MEFCCDGCGKGTLEPYVYTCGHWICKTCGVSEYCPLDKCYNLAADQFVQEELSILSRDNNAERKEKLEAYIAARYPWKCYQCHFPCRPDYCYRCTPPLQQFFYEECSEPTDYWECPCGFQQNTSSSFLCSSCHMPKASQQSRNVTWYSCTCSGNARCGFCSLKDQMTNGTWWSDRGSPLMRGKCEGCGAGLQGLQYVYCSNCRPGSIVFRPSE
jgi:hypothetical protein